MNDLAKRDKKIQQLHNHISELEKLLKNNSREIHKKEKTNKYLSNVKNQFKEYDDVLNNLKEQQLNSFNSLKLYLQAINDEEYSEQIQQDLNEIEREIEKFK
jgi:protein subunit release factor A